MASRRRRFELSELAVDATAATTFQLELPARLRAHGDDAEGQPAAGISVRLLERRGERTLVVEALTDANGDAFLHSLPPKRALTVELADGFALLWRDQFALTFASGEGLVKRLELRHGKAFSARVLDQYGQPVAAARVFTEGRRERSEDAAADAAAVAMNVGRVRRSWSGTWVSIGDGLTDESGRARLDNLPTNFDGWVIVGVYGKQDQEPEFCHAPVVEAIEVAADQRSAFAELTVERGLSIFGQLVGPAGEPAVGTAHGEWRTANGVVESRLASETEADGRVSFNGVSSDAVVRVSGLSKDHTLRSRRDVVARAGGAAVAVKLKVHHPLLLRAKDAAGVDQVIRTAEFFTAAGNLAKRESNDHFWFEFSEDSEQPPILRVVDEQGSMACQDVDDGRYTLLVSAGPASVSAASVTASRTATATTTTTTPSSRSATNCSPWSAMSSSIAARPDRWT